MTIQFKVLFTTADRSELLNFKQEKKILSVRKLGPTTKGVLI